MRYPGRILQRGDRGELVRRLQEHLNARGVGPLDIDGDFGPATERAMRLFQARFPDLSGVALTVDGKAGPLTWGALFGEAPPAGSPPRPSSLPQEALVIARTQIGVREDPTGSNRGPQVDRYLAAAGLDADRGSYAWCAAFVYWCVGEAAKTLERDNPLPRTAGVLNLWRRAGSAPAMMRLATAKPCVVRTTALNARQDPGLVRPGSLFFLSTGGGLGHVGFVEDVELGAYLVTIEGNTSEAGSREGIGVFRRRRKLWSVSLGFLDYSAC